MLSKEQRSVARRILRGLDREQVQTLGGYAGTGKSTIVQHLAERLPEFAPCAFTGKAAHVLRQKGLTVAKTIHSLIYHPTPDGNGSVKFTLRLPQEMSAKGFLVDEASMVSDRLHCDLLNFGLPIVFVGDHGQLPPVGSDINLMQNPNYRLEEIHRNAGPIAHFAEHLRKGRPARRFHGERCVRIVRPSDVTDRMLLRANQVIVAFNRSRVGINANVRRLLGRTRLLEPGDRIICLRNHAAAGLFNGQQGIVDRVNIKKRWLDFTDDDGNEYRGLRYDPTTFGAEKSVIDTDPSAAHSFDYSHAVTCHKSQGSEWSRVLVFEQRCRYWEHSRWTYTAASRAKQRLTWVTPN